MDYFSDEKFQKRWSAKLHIILIFKVLWLELKLRNSKLIEIGKVNRNINLKADASRESQDFHIIVKGNNYFIPHLCLVLRILVIRLNNSIHNHLRKSNLNYKNSLILFKIKQKSIQGILLSWEQDIIYNERILSKENMQSLVFGIVLTKKKALYYL